MKFLHDLHSYGTEQLHSEGLAQFQVIVDVVINSQKKFAILKYLIMFLFHSFCKNSLYQGVCIQFFFLLPLFVRPSAKKVTTSQLSIVYKAA